jgi:hypothetical protein
VVEVSPGYDSDVDHRPRTGMSGGGKGGVLPAELLNETDKKQIKQIAKQ